MSSIRTFVRSVALALTFAIAAAPAVALAEDSGRPAPAEGKKDGEHGKHHGKRGERKGRGEGERPQFPMDAKKFQELVEKRIAKAREHLEGAMERHSVPEPIRAQIRKEFDAGAAAIREEAKRAVADGTVTKDEAKEVRELSRDLRKQAREKLRPEGKGKGKGKRAGQDA